MRLAFAAPVRRKAELHAESGEAAAPASYERGATDESIERSVVGDAARIREGDTAIFFNFRPDRARQMTTKLGEFGANLTTLTEYQEDWAYPVAFPPERQQTTLASTLA